MAIDSETGVITVNDSDELDFETNPSFSLEVTATDTDGSSGSGLATLNVNEIDTAEFDTSASNNGFFTLDGGDSTNIKFTLVDNDTENVNELGVFLVDDKFGFIDGATTDTYLQDAVERSQVVFSGVSNRPSGFDLADIQRILEFDGDASFGFYLVSNGTTDTVLNDLETTATTDLSVFFSTSDNLEVSDFSTTGFNLNWSDGSGSDFNDMQVVVELTDETPPLATDLQGEPENELIDLRDVTGEVSVSVEVHREAAFDNLIGFYQIADTNGGIDTTGDGITDINVGDAGYEQAALANRITSLDLLKTDNQQTSSFDGILEGGSLLASFIVVDGTVDDAINDSAEVYFSFLGANSDGVDHIRLLGDNTFGFEDLASGGDNDFNDMIVNMKFS